MHYDRCLDDKELDIVAGGANVVNLPFVNITIVTGIKQDGKEYVGICGRSGCGFGEVK